MVTGQRFNARPQRRCPDQPHRAVPVGADDPKRGTRDFAACDRETGGGKGRFANGLNHGVLNAFAAAAS